MGNNWWHTWVATKAQAAWAGLERRELLFYIHCNAPIKTLGNGKKINSLCSSCFEVFVQAQGSWKWVPCQGVQFSGTGAPQSCKQPVVLVDQVTSLTQHILHSNFSFCSVSRVYIPWPPCKQVQCVSILPLLSAPSPHHVEGDSQKQVPGQDLHFKMQFLQKAETQVSYVDYLIPWNVLGNVL